jgi:hypothetical protein
MIAPKILSKILKNKIRFRKRRFEKTITNYDRNDDDAYYMSNESPFIDRLDHNTLLVFMHIPKAGGTSLNNYLAQIYGNHMVKFHKQFNPELLSKTTPEKAKDIWCISSHHQYPLHRWFGCNSIYDEPMQGDGLFKGRDIKYITIVRKPTERLISYYNFVTTFVAHHHHENTKNMNIIEFFKYLEDINDVEIKNLQCSLISGVWGANFDQAKSVIDRYYSYSTVERSNAFIRHLSKSLNWPETIQYEIRNISPKKSKQQDVDPDLLSFLYQTNSEDQKLYEYIEKQTAKFF